ncbi:hypothetical protein P9112_000507 [Eukaryota sp. TZLM1-RC]
MDRTSLGVSLPTIANQVFVVSYNLNDKPSFTPIAFAGCCNMEPPMMSLTVGRSNLLNEVLKSEKFCTLNLATPDMCEAVDRSGSVSARDTDKSMFFEYDRVDVSGQSAYLIHNSPMNIVCKVRTVVENTDDLFILDVVELFAHRAVLGAEGKPMMSKDKVNPMFFSFDGPSYYQIGENVSN